MSDQNIITNIKAELLLEKIQNGEEGNQIYKEKERCLLVDKIIAESQSPQLKPDDLSVLEQLRQMSLDKRTNNYDDSNI